MMRSKVRLKYKLNQGWKRLRGWLGLGLLILSLVYALDLSSKVTQFLSKATGRKAEIVVDAANDLGTMPQPWKNLAQGGEESDGMMGQVTDKIAPLSIKYIRLDHIYDYYEVANKDGGNLSFNFGRLDAEVDEILRAGAKPFLALSYMPPALGGEVIGPPNDWNDWQRLVQATIEHYSGKANKNISNVYYEVWNEPDLFGDWKTRGEKNYLEMYRRAAVAAENAGNVQEFKIGGPATTGMYPAWIEALLNLVDEANLRLDFVSWHRYSLDIDDFKEDVEGVNKLLEKHPKLALKEKIVSEWGFDPENNDDYDAAFGAAHLVAVSREMLGRVHKGFIFEIMDGKNPEGKVYWGRYGLLTHSDHGLLPKPRYEAVKWLNEIGPVRLQLAGEGSWVRGMAAKKDDEVQVYLVNYDQFKSHFETVPVIVKNLKPGNYQVIEESFNGSRQAAEVTINNGTWAGQVMLNPNGIIRLRLVAQ